ncbi:MAG: hypothetical protein M1836_002329 [Candelina mexicana]|nr:MAG: hypothetical protein M1836_002329 [Candelina mexicana]
MKTDNPLDDAVALNEEMEIRDIIAVCRWSGKPHDWEDRLEEWNERAKSLALFYFYQSPSAPAPPLSLSRAGTRPVYLVDVPSNTNFSISNVSDLPYLRGRLNAHTKQSPDRRRITIVMSQPDGLTTNAIGLRAFLQSYQALNLHLFIFDSNDEFAEYSASDVCAGITAMELKQPVNTTVESYLMRAVEGGCRKEGIALMKRGMSRIGYRNRNKTVISPFRVTKDVAATTSNAGCMESVIELSDDDDQQATTSTEPKLYACKYPGCTFACSVDRGPEITNFVQASGFHINADNVFVSVGLSSSSDAAAAMFPWQPDHRIDATLATPSALPSPTPSLTDDGSPDTVEPAPKRQHRRPKDEHVVLEGMDDWKRARPAPKRGNGGRRKSEKPPKAFYRRESRRPSAIDIATMTTGTRSAPNEDYTPLDDCLIIRLKELEGKGWPAIAAQFPGRKWGTVQQRYTRYLRV